MVRSLGSSKLAVTPAGIVPVVNPLAGIAVAVITPGVDTGGCIVPPDPHFIAAVVFIPLVMALKADELLPDPQFPTNFKLVGGVPGAGTMAQGWATAAALN